MLDYRVVAALAAVLTITWMGPSVAAQYYLSPDGDDGNPGSREAPWRSLEKASETAQAGDTVTLLPGTYPGQLRPANSGTADAPIVFRAEPRMGATLTGPEQDVTIVLEGREHITVEGLHLDPDGQGTGWIRIVGCSHITVEDCRMENSTGRAAHIEDSEDLRIRNTVFHKQTGGINMMRVSGVTRLLFEGNVISRAGHSPLQFWPDNSNHFVVMRGNVFHAAWGRNLDKHGTQHCLFEHNIITHAVNSGWSGSAHSKFNSTHGIFRFNRVFRNPHGPIHLYPYRDVWTGPIRFYSNVFDESGNFGLLITSAHAQTTDLVFANNIFTRSDPHGNERQIALTGGSPEQVRFVSNVITGSRPGLQVVQDYGSAFTVDAVQGEAVRAEHGARYEDNMDVDPGYLDPEQYNHALREDSVLRDAGRFLTSAVGAGQGTLLVVRDAGFFYDGYGIEGEQGDLIAVGASANRARVVSVDYEANTLLLDRELSWQDGDPVSLPWSGQAPDIGVYEHGDDGRVAVQVVVEPFEARPGEEVTLRAVIHGDAQPRLIRWWLGDGNIAEGAEVRHRYDEEYDYAIRVQMVDTEGNIHYGPGYVWVAEPVDPTAPLIHSTWGPEDTTAWRLWKSYHYPGPAGYMDVVEGGVRHGPNSTNIPPGYSPPGGGTNFRHVRAPEDRGGLPTRIYPIGWDIDRYPEVFIRYRLGEGTPLVLLLAPFAGRAVQVAGNPAVQSPYRRLADHALHDDGQWHELVFDVRKIREIIPDVQVLQAMFFLRTSQDAVRQGHWYDLDEVIIRPLAR